MPMPWLVMCDMQLLLDPEHVFPAVRCWHTDRLAPRRGSTAPTWSTAVLPVGASDTSRPGTLLLLPVPCLDATQSLLGSWSERSGRGWTFGRRDGHARQPRPENALVYDVYDWQVRPYMLVYTVACRPQWGRLKMREQKTRHRQKCRGGKRKTGKRGTSV